VLSVIIAGLMGLVLLLFALVLVGSLTSRRHAADNVEPETGIVLNAQLKSEILRHLEDIAHDPNSVQWVRGQYMGVLTNLGDVWFTSFQDYVPIDDYHTFKVTYRAKNRFGALERMQLAVLFEYDPVAPKRCRTLVASAPWSAAEMMAAMTADDEKALMGALERAGDIEIEPPPRRKTGQAIFD
jgi:hypothetical protein